MEGQLDEVSNWLDFVERTVQIGKTELESFKAGRLISHLSFWESLTFDPFILTLVQGAKLKFEPSPDQYGCPRPYNLKVSDGAKIDREVQIMLQKGIIEHVDSKNDIFVSNIFSRNKSDGAIKIILDLSKFNEHVVHKHFKMENIKQALDLMEPSCYMVSIDWKDA